MKIVHLHVPDQKNKGDVAVVEATREVLGQSIAPSKIIGLPILTLKKLTPRVLNQINQGDLALIGGGGIFHRFFLPYDTKNLPKIKIPIAIYAAGYNQEIGTKSPKANEKESIKALCHQAKVISVRGPKSKNFLTKIGVKKKIRVIGDPAIFLPEGSASLAGTGLKVGFNLTYSGWLGFGRYSKQILESYCRLMDWLHDRKGAQIYYLLHHPDEVKILPSLDFKNYQIIDFSPKNQKAVYRQLDLVIGMMLHSAIFSFGAGTPFINIGYDVKNQGFADLINTPELVVHPARLTPEVLINKVEKVLINQKTYQEKFELKKQSLFRKQADFWEEAGRLVSPERAGQSGRN